MGEINLALTAGLLIVRMGQYCKNAFIKLILCM